MCFLYAEMKGSFRGGACLPPSDATEPIRVGQTLPLRNHNSLVQLPCSLCSILINSCIFDLNIVSSLPWLNLSDLCASLVVSGRK